MEQANVKTQTDYLGGFQYRLAHIPTTEGYIRLEGTNFSYIYNYTDHLGNIKVSYALQNNVLKVLEENNYYPFGLKHIGYNANNAQPNYKYKYQGQEFQNELGLNWSSFKWRNYDATIGRFMSVDPLAEKYPSISPYVYVANNPIVFIDPDGRDIVLPKGTSTKDIYTILGNLQKLTNDRLVYSTQKDGSIRIKIASLARSGTENKPAGTNLIRRLNSSDKIVTIDIQDSQGNFSNGQGNKAKAVNYIDATNGKGSDAIVSFDPTSDPNIMTVDPKTGNVFGSKRPSQIGLGHELIHADHYMKGNYSPSSQTASHTYTDAHRNTVTQTYKKEELRTVGLAEMEKDDITENQLRKEQNQNPRGAY